MLRALAYTWALFGAYWIVFAPALASKSAWQTRSQKFRLGFLAIIFLLLLWKADAIPPIWIIVLGLAWAMLGLLWVAPKTETRSGEYRFYRLLRLLVAVITFALLFWEKTAIGVLGHRFLQRNSAIIVSGFIATLVGLAITAWARVHLGHYWSDRIAIQSHHQLVRSGPYARMRHPIYSGVLLGIAGTALVVGEWRAILSLAIMCINYVIKAKREDNILAERFGQEFRSYEQGSGMLLPRLISRPPLTLK